jgi:uncharacterized protein (TIGR04255 family)
VSSSLPEPNNGDGLPEFSNPPVVEVALSVQFTPLPGFRPIRLGRLQDTWRAEYPHYEEQPPLAGVIEGSLQGVMSLQLVA